MELAFGSFSRLERAAEILGAYMKAIEAGDWRASESLLTRVFGRPHERLEVEVPKTVEEVNELSLREIMALRRQFEVIDGGEADPVKETGIAT
jgi:hypothetical protein